MTHEIKSPYEIESELDVEVSHMEALTNGGYSQKSDCDLTGFDDVVAAANTAEADWKIAEAKGLIKIVNTQEGRGEAEWKIKARVLALNDDLYRAYRMKAGAKESHLEAIRTARSHVDSARTKCANRRGQD